MYNAMYQVFLVLIPLITVPYVSRVLGPNTYGIYSYVKFSIQFLMVLCAFAISSIGVRTIARVRMNGTPKELTKAFWGLWYLQAIASFVVIVLTVLIVSTGKIKYWPFFYLQLPLLVSAMFDIAWFFQGLEDFGRVVIRNTLVKLTTVVLIFSLVKSSEDLWKYMLISSVSTMLGSFVFWISIRKYVGRPVKSFYHLKSTLIAVGTLLLPQIAMKVYNTLDKPILGTFQSTTQVAFYDNSQRISMMILGVITSISIVMMPKMASSKKEHQKFFMKKSYDVSLMLGLIFASVVMVNTREFVPFFFGDKFTGMIHLMMASTLLIVFIPIGDVFANQFALAARRDKDFAVPVIIGAVLSLFLNFTLDPKFGAEGAMFTVIFTEFIVCALRIWRVRDAIDFQYVFGETPKYLFIALITTGIGWILPNFVGSAFFDMTIKSIIMMLVYAVLFFALKFELNKDVLKLAQKVFKR